MKNENPEAMAKIGAPQSLRRGSRPKPIEPQGLWRSAKQGFAIASPIEEIWRIWDELSAEYGYMLSRFHARCEISRLIRNQPAGCAFAEQVSSARKECRQRRTPPL